MTVAVKICGLTRPEDGTAAAGATFVGVVFFPPSPRFIMPGDAAAILEKLPDRVGRVGLFVDPDDAWLATVTRHVRLNMIQLHGRESPTRVTAVRQTFGVPVMKALSLRTYADLKSIPAYVGVADWLLFDAKAPTASDRPGGHGLAFDWELLSSSGRWPIPWMLAGGLTPTNVIEAIRCTGANAVDVSSGVEERPGVKSATKIQAFLEAVRKI
ncbi:MAG: phosphoribosylanthranilate isomerase [Rhodospirillaceae bacterium]|nr:MAG: phosphoribosylanthranilate isomerase [Rhodospirillaceae bacterium]